MSVAAAAVVRPFEPGELSSVLGLWRALMENGRAADERWKVRPGGQRLVEGWAREAWPRRSPFPHCWVAAIEGEIVGYLDGHVVHVLPVLDTPPTARIGNLWVDPARRRSGLGRDLVEHFVSAARQGGHPHVEVGTLVADERAVAFWRALGFGDWHVVLRREEAELTS